MRQVIMQPAHPSGLLTTREAATLAGVQPPTIRAWRAAGILAPQGLDERGYPLHSAKAVRDAEQAVRESALTKGGFDPRRTRAGAKSEAA
jgi:MerR HTH family regulatory protein